LLLERLAKLEGMGKGRRRLVVLFPQLGDFDSLEYAQALVAAWPQLEAAGIAVLAIGIGDGAGRQRFCAFTGFPSERLQVDADPQLHRALGLYEGLQQVGGPWANLLLMCAGLGSPGTLAEVWRGYTGDRSAPQRIADDQTILAPPPAADQGVVLHQGLWDRLPATLRAGHGALAQHGGSARPLAHLRAPQRLPHPARRHLPPGGRRLRALQLPGQWHPRLLSDHGQATELPRPLPRLKRPLGSQARAPGAVPALDGVSLFSEANGLT
jgi:hypothetical protein